MSKKASFLNSKIILILLGCVVLYSLYRRAKGQRGTSARYNVKTFQDYQRIFPQAFRPIDSELSAAPPLMQDSKGEQRCRAYLEKTLGVPFPKARPWFLNNPITGAVLELDCFNEQLRLAVEYQGEQHYKYVSHFHKSRDAFQNGRYRDAIKRDLCKKNSIILIEVPHYCLDIEQFLANALIENGFTLSFQ